MMEQRGTMQRNENKNKPLLQTDGTDSLQEDLFSDDFNGIFDDDGPSSEEFSFDASTLDFADTPQESTANSSMDGAPSDPGKSAQDSEAKPAKTEGKRKRQTGIIKIEQGEKGLPPPSWHSEAADKPHRQSMILEM
jgi:hypothetical protein